MKVLFIGNSFTARNDAPELEVTIAGQTQIAGPGSVAIIPSNTAHSVKALSDGQSIVVDYPLWDMVGGVNTD